MIITRFKSYPYNYKDKKRGYTAARHTEIIVLRQYSLSFYLCKDRIWTKCHKRHKNDSRKKQQD